MRSTLVITGIFKGKCFVAHVPLLSQVLSGRGGNYGNAEFAIIQSDLLADILVVFTPKLCGDFPYKSC